MGMILKAGARHQLGGKGAQLVALREMGLPVPPFFVLGVDAEIHTPEALAALEVALEALGPGPVAVRSSALGEDAGQASFAGQFDTILCVEGTAAILEAIRNCRPSSRSERAEVYRQRHGLDASATRMAVVIQRMFPSQVSGVMFTADPTDPDREAILLSAAWGLGEGVVGGHADTDSYTVTAEAVEAEIGHKLRMVAATEGGGTALMEVPTQQRDIRCLSDEQALELASIGARLEAHFGLPQDIEWAYDAEGELAILQTRALTGVGPRRGRLYTWDNSNIVESYSGVTTPLTYAFARSAYESVYRQFCEVMGVPQRVIDENAAVFKAMIGLIGGRVYYRLDSWYQVLTLLPGARYNKRFMEQMMGVRKQADLESASSPAGKIRIVYLMWRMIRALLELGKRTAQFKALFAESYARYHNRDLTALSAPELVAAYRDLEQALLLNWKAPIINDFYAMIFFGVLKKMAPEHHNDLLCGEPGMESTLPTREVITMAAALRSSAELSQLFESADDAGVLAAVAQGAPGTAPLKAWLDQYIDRFGDRCMEELKLETPTLRDDPSFIIATLRNYAGRPDLTIGSMETREQSVRAAAETSVKVPLLKRPLFNFILRRTRRHVRERENLRFARTRVFGLVRRIFRALGEHLTRVGLLDDTSDVFYLTVEETFGLVEGTTVNANVRPLVDARRQEFERYREEAPPSDRFETRGGVHMGNLFIDTEVADHSHGDVLSGLGCAPGVVRNIARVIHSPKDDLSVNGKIMVCERTDPGWVPLFPTCSGLLVERGSALSHSAIVAREFGIPTVVGIPKLLSRVADGQWLELDGKAGTVRLDVTEAED